MLDSDTKKIRRCWNISNLTVEPGQTVAFVGPSGVGKTTLVNLLPRFYDLKEGEILIDGTNINRFTLQSLRRQIGIVQQDVFLFNGTIRENVLYGRLDATDEEVDRAIEQAKLKEVIEDLEDGVDTHIGERGVKLSGGQKTTTLNCSYFLEESFYFNLGRSNECARYTNREVYSTIV